MNLARKGVSIAQMREYSTRWQGLESFVVMTTEDYCSFKHGNRCVGVVVYSYDLDLFIAIDHKLGKKIGGFETMLQAKAALAESLDNSPPRKELSSAAL